MNHLSKPCDLIAGLLVFATGAGFLFLSLSLEVGTAERMGPGYFPVMLSLLAIVLGGALAIKGARSEKVPLSGVLYKKVAVVLGSVLLFAATARGLGFVPAIFLTTALAASASKFASVWEVSLIAGVTTLLSYLIFIFALGIPLPAFGLWLSF